MNAGLYFIHAAGTPALVTGPAGDQALRSRPGGFSSSGGGGGGGVLDRLGWRWGLLCVNAYCGAGGSLRGQLARPIAARHDSGLTGGGCSLRGRFRGRGPFDAVSFFHGPGIADSSTWFNLVRLVVALRANTLRRRVRS